MELQSQIYRNPGWRRKTLKGTLIAALVIMGGFLCNHVELPKSLAYTVFRGVNKYGIGLQTKGWKTLKGNHFEVRYQPDDKEVADIVLETAEMAVEPVNSRLGYAPRGKMLVLVYPTREALGKSFGWAADQSAMGVYWAGIIRVLSPRAWIESESPGIVAEEFQTSGPMVHEYTHLVVDYMAKGNYPRWFTEGIAQYIERDVTGFMLSDQTIVSGDTWYSLEDLDRSFDTPSGQGKAYRQSLAMMDYLSQAYGEKAFVGILRRLGQGASFNWAWKEETGVSLGQFEENFNYWTNTPAATERL